MKKLDGKLFINETEKSKEKKYSFKNSKKLIKYKYNIIHLKFQYLFNIIILIYIIIKFPISLAKNFFQHLSGLYQITLTINTNGLIQVINSNFSRLPSKVKVNNVETTLENGKVNLVSNLNNVILIWNSAIPNCSYMFNDLTNINQIDLSSFVSSSVEYMNNMFYNCKSLSKIIFTSFTTSNAIKMNHMFYNCISLTSLDLSNFDTSKVNDISYMFYNCKALNNLKLVGFSNSLAINMMGIFQNCISLTSLDLSRFYTPKAEITWDMFNGCKSLVSLDLSTFDTSQVTDMESMFEGCESLVSLDLNHFQTSRVKYMRYMFKDCYKLEYVYMKNIQVHSSLTMEEMFYNCLNLKYINLFSIDQTASTISNMFRYTSGNFTFCIEDETRIPDIFNLLLGIINVKRDCTNKCYTQNQYAYFNPETKKCDTICSYNTSHKYLYNYDCYDSCPKRTYHETNSYLCEDLNCNLYYNYNQTGCLSTLEDGYFVNNSDLKTIDKCYEDCKTCSQKGTINNQNCLSCYEGKFYNYGNCISNCTNGYYIDYEDNSIKKCKCSNIKCNKCSSESLEINLCITCNEDEYFYPKFEEHDNSTYIDCYNSPQEGYYLENKYYKKCYRTCTSCYGAGNLTNNNCQNCIENHFFLNDFQNDKNCYNNCEYNYYFDNDKNYHCTQNSGCPEEYNKFIPEKKKCIDKCSNDNEYRYEYKNKCLIKCPIRTKNNNYICEDLNCTNYYNYNQTECINEIEEGFYENDTDKKTIDRCHKDCRACDKKPTENNTNCKSCPPDKYLYYGKCISNCPNDYFTDEQDNTIKICKCNNSKCFYCSEEALSLNLCNSCNNDYYPKLNDTSNKNNYFDCYQSPQGYYLDKELKYYKSCYYTCKTCDEPGSEKENKCKSCQNTHIFKTDFPNDYNCYEKCQFYYYFDNKKNYFCTKNLECPKDYNKLISNKLKCIDDCSKDNLFQFEFRKQCFDGCPPNTIKSENKNNYCEIICPKEFPFEMVDTQECVNNCSIDDRTSQKCIQNYKNENETQDMQDEIQKDFQNDITKEEFNKSDIDNGNDKTYTDNKTTFSVTTTKNQKNNEKNNVTTLNLGECEKRLRKYYSIPDDDALYIFKIDVIQEGIQVPKIEYEVYYPLSGTKLEKLDLNICQDTKVEVSIPVNINKDELDKHDPNSKFYNDICYAYTSDKGTDISLEDRKKQFIENNYTLCEENCDLTGYDENTKKVKCSCQMKIKLPLVSEISIDKNRLYDSFSNIKNIANLKLMKCYKVLFTKEGILNNIGCYIMIPIIIFHFITMIIFYLKDYKEIKNIIKQLLYIKKNWKLFNKKDNFKTENNKRRKSTIKSKKPKINLDMENKCNNSNINKIDDEKINEKEESKNNENNNLNIRKRNDRTNSEKLNLKILNNINKDKKDTDYILNKIEKPLYLKYINNKNNEKKDTKDTDNILSKIEEPLYLKYIMKKEIGNKNNDENKNSPPIKKEKGKEKEKIRKTRRNYSFNRLKTMGNFTNSSIKYLEMNNNQFNKLKIDKPDIINGNENEHKIKINLSLMKPNEYEINTLTYDEAIISDKRNYIQFYFSLLKTQHLFLFSFFPSNDYNSRIIKIYLFFFSFTIYYTVNALFFSDATMHKIYEDGGDFNFIYQIPQILYSSLISNILHTMLKSLSLSEKNIIEIKHEKIIHNLDKKAIEIVKCLYYKFILFFIISLSFLLLFWYYVSCFCAVYKNTQLHLIKDSIISFCLSLLYPIFIYIFPGIFRIYALRAPKKDKETMYKFSKIIQLL